GRRSAGWLLLVGIVPIVATAAAIFSARAAGDGAAFVPPAAILPAIGLQVVTGAVGEELGWRGFLLPRLAQRLREMRSAWTMAILWSLWHVPAFFTCTCDRHVADTTVAHRPRTDPFVNHA